MTIIMDTMDKAIPTPTTPLSRADYLQRKRNTTKATILQAAKLVFAETNYADAKVEDIFRRAGVSRATFYSHFVSKRELATAIYEEIVPQTEALFLSLPPLVEKGRTGVREWLESFIALHIAHKYATPLIAQLQLFEDEFRRRILADADVLIDCLGNAGIRSYSLANGQDRAAQQQRVRARLMMNRVATVCAEIAREEITGDETELYLSLIENDILAFIDENI